MKRWVVGLTFVEVLVAASLLAMASLVAVASWSQLHRVPRSQMRAERALAVSISELEHYRALGFENAPIGTSVRWYDRHGAWLGDAASTGEYRAATTTAIAWSVPNLAVPKYVLECKVRVTDPTDSVLYREATTLLIYGGS